ncbi:MAG TPA: hypothetical protein VH482_21380 [Thermomicrobiales bacterium]
MRDKTRHRILDIYHRKRKPSLYVTHDQGEALAMADRIGVMAKGRMQQIGTPEELLDKPATAFVAGFIGTPAMNLLPATVTFGLSGGWRLLGVFAENGDLSAGQRVRLAIREGGMRLFDAESERALL